MRSFQSYSKNILLLGYLICNFLDNSAAGATEEITLYSKTLQESRKIQISTPKNFSSSKSYPVIYVLDGDGHFEHVVSVTNFLSENYRIPPVIIVGIRNMNRVRDFTPVHSLVRLDGTTDSIRFASTGGGEKFLRFFSEELIPFIDKNYKTQPYRILFGHSLGGLFSLYAFENSPGLFQSFVIISPAFFGGNKSVLSSLPDYLQKNKNRTSIYLTIGNEPRLQSGVDTLRHYLGNSSQALSWNYKNYENEDHSSVPYISWYDGLKFIYSNWYFNISDSSRYSSYNDVATHFSALSKKMDYTISPTEEVVNAFGYEQLYFFKNTEAAIFTFQQNIKNNPESATVYSSLAEAYNVKGEKALAIKNYELSLRINPKNEKVLSQLQKLKAIR